MPRQSKHTKSYRNFNVNSYYNTHETKSNKGFFFKLVVPCIVIQCE